MIREGKLHLVATFIVNSTEPYVPRNIITHHAEDGSGVGSAIIAGLMLILSIRHVAYSAIYFSDDQGAEGCGDIPECLMFSIIP